MTYATRSWLHVVGLALLIGAIGGEVEASKVRPVNLEEMTERAATIFQGRCVGIRELQDEALGTTVIEATFQVDRVVKGEAGKIITVRMPHLEAGGNPTAGLPRFRKGEEVVLFLYGESPLGFRTPVGWGQGKFSVTSDKHGNRIAINGTGNRNLWTGLSKAATDRLEHARGGAGASAVVSPAALLEMVESLRGQPARRTTTPSVKPHR